MSENLPSLTVTVTEHVDVFCDSSAGRFISQKESLTRSQKFEILMKNRENEADLLLTAL